MDVEMAPDVQAKVEEIVRVLEEEYGHVNAYRLVCMRSRQCTARAYARIWNLPDIWQKALELSGPFYVIEVLNEWYDPLPEEEKEKTLVHELLHIPHTFSGALRPHTHAGGRIDKRTVDKIWRRYCEKKSGAANP